MKLGFDFCFNVSIKFSYDVYFKYNYVYGSRHSTKLLLFFFLLLL